MEWHPLANLKGQARAVGNGMASIGNLKGQAHAVWNGKVSIGKFKGDRLAPLGMELHPEAV